MYLHETRTIVFRSCNSFSCYCFLWRMLALTKERDTYGFPRNNK